jgi:hypothetical protein
MPCFADLEPGNYGPGRVTQQEIRDTFRDGWSGTSIRPAVFGSRTRAEGSCAWRSLKKNNNLWQGCKKGQSHGIADGHGRRNPSPARRAAAPHSAMAGIPERFCIHSLI